MKFESLHKLQICEFVRTNSPSTEEVLRFAQGLTGRRLRQSTVSSMLRKNNLQIQKGGGRGRRVKEDIKISPQDSAMSSVAHIEIRALTLLKEGNCRNRPSKNVDLEVKMLEQIYHVLSSGQRLITVEYLQKTVAKFCSTGLHERPDIPRFLRDLKNKYYLADKVYLYLNKKLSYAQTLDSLASVYPHLSFATRDPPIVEEGEHSAKVKCVQMREAPEQLPMSPQHDQASFDCEQLENMDFNFSHDLYNSLSLEQFYREQGLIGLSNSASNEVMKVPVRELPEHVPRQIHQDYVMPDQTDLDWEVPDWYLFNDPNLSLLEQVQLEHFENF